MLSASACTAQGCPSRPRHTAPRQAASDPVYAPRGCQTSQPPHSRPTMAVARSCGLLLALPAPTCSACSLYSCSHRLLLFASCYRHKANERCCVLVTVCVVLALRRRPAEFQHEHEHPPLCFCQIVTS